MFPAAYDLKEYYLTAQGRGVAALLARRLAAWWPKMSADDLLIGAGYTLPYLEACTTPRKSFALLSGPAGAIAWPAGGPQRCMVADRGQWPLPSACVDCVVMVHELEYAEDPSAVLDDVWRVLKPEGRLLLVVPNRTGLWARAERTPFGHGRPFTATQLHDVLRDRNFVLERMGGALLAPPFKNATFSARVAPVLEAIAPVCSALCGVIVAEASKRLYAPIRGKTRPVTNPVLAWGAPAVQGRRTSL